MDIQGGIFNRHNIAFERFEQKITGFKPTGKWPLPTTQGIIQKKSESSSRTLPCLVIFFWNIILIWKFQKWSLNWGTLVSAIAIYQMKCPFTVLSALFCTSRCCPMILDYSMLVQAFEKKLSFGNVSLKKEITLISHDYLSSHWMTLPFTYFLFKTCKLSSLIGLLTFGAKKTTWNCSCNHSLQTLKLFQLNIKWN